MMTRSATALPMPKRLAAFRITCAVLAA
jgi:hypothetical protein